MDELYQYMKAKLEEMRGSLSMTIPVDYVEFAKLYQLVCYMKQIKTIANGMDEVLRDD